MLTIRPSKTRLYQGFPGPLLGQAVCFYGLPLFCRNAVNICPAASGHFVQRWGQPESSLLSPSYGVIIYI